VSSSGERSVRAYEFFVDSLTSVAKANEILTEISFNAPKMSGGSYAKLERKTTDFATVGVAAQLSLDSSGRRCKRAGIGLASVATTSIRASKAENVLNGSEVTKNRIEEAASAAAEESRPTDDPLRGSAEYKRAMVKVFAVRALTQALDRAKRND
jgi:aerobic carbon-monoxide dehydrogenase medium subunit